MRFCDIEKNEQFKKKKKEIVLVLSHFSEFLENLASTTPS